MERDPSRCLRPSRKGRKIRLNIAVDSSPKPKAAKKKNATMTLLQFEKSAYAGFSEVTMLKTDHCDESVSVRDGRSRLDASYRRVDVRPRVVGVSTRIE